ncbi:MAG: type II toxin-antitoxin system HicA family toxin [Candidatus Aminicenantes bacterium]|nr:type II toxin-antitoxin system HicA family toxin [Candidatus Aminicenantes bacterium]
MPRIPGISSEQAIKALGKIGFRIIRKGKHIIMSNGQTRLTIPGHKNINAFTMGAIAADAGLTPDEFKRLI